MSRKKKVREENIRVTKHFTFEMAHALYNYDGPCKNIHGHSYKLDVTLIGRPFLSAGHPEDGLVIDFSSLKKIVQKEILDHFDHALVLNGAVPKKVTKLLHKQFDKILMLPYQPSCENLIIEFKNRLTKVCGDKYKLFSVRLKETDNSWAEWNVNDN